MTDERTVTAIRTPVATAGSVAFFLAAPGVVAGLVPWLLSDWALRQPLPDGFGWLTAALRVAGAAVLLAGAAALVHAFVWFVAEGAGTPAPVAPTEQLVVGGLYRFVRNPMYVAVLAAVIGQALLFGQPDLLLYAAVVAAAVVAFVRWYEEPALRHRYGAAYEQYRRAVPGWWPRLRPWRPT